MFPGDREQHTARHHGGFTLVDASAGHTSMGPFDDDRDALRLEDPLQGIGDLRRDPLLNLKPLGIDLDESRQFGNSHDPVVREIADMGTPDDRRHVVLAMGDETDVAQKHHLIISSNFLESSLQEFLGVLAVSGRRVRL
jgi:hypothetical protein